MAELVPWGIWILIPIILQAIFRRRGGYFHRNLVSLLCLMVSAMYGMAAALTLPIVGKSHLINWTVARFHKILNRRFLDIGAVVEGEENFAAEGQSAIYVCNHQTLMDIVYMGAMFPKSTSVVSKKAIKYYPILGWFMTLSKSIFLDRTNREGAIKQARQAAEDIHRKKTSVFIFPEGTRSGVEKVDLLPFKKGAFYMATQAKVPIIPIVVANYKQIYDPNKKHFGYGSIKIKVLPAIDTKDVDEDSASIEKLVNQVRDKMLTTLLEISEDQKTK
ncbi:hypothetical protein HPULCUR_009150 [Helicostylum pulchrum]|uniref:1-acyl-sn-glycerol-3-phosphate acyltransferase n=1 Tax=Helicostylum pulchrum TaxID=562976 RepID=A0ABP9Y9M2_9FUNG